MTILTIIITVLITLVLLAWLGLQIKPAPFPALPKVTEAPETVPLPADLPSPVARFYRELYGDELPVIDSAVVSGRASMRIMGVTFPARFRFTHKVGQAYRHTIRLSFFGFPIMRVNETYLKGESRLELPFGVIEHERKVNQGANLALWSEAIWFPSLFVTDERVSWEAVDNATALLIVPFDDGFERFVVRFDPATGLIRLLESMRFKEAGSPEKTLWLNEVLAWDMFNDDRLPASAALTWLDEGTPWAVWKVEEVVHNADVEADLRP